MMECVGVCVCSLSVPEYCWVLLCCCVCLVVIAKVLDTYRYERIPISKKVDAERVGIANNVVWIIVVVQFFLPPGIPKAREEKAERRVECRCMTFEYERHDRRCQETRFHGEPVDWLTSSDVTPCLASSVGRVTRCRNRDSPSVVGTEQSQRLPFANESLDGRSVGLLWHKRRVG